MILPHRIDVGVSFDLESGFSRSVYRGSFRKLSVNSNTKKYIQMIKEHYKD